MLLEMFEAAVRSALPDGKFHGRLPNPPKGRSIVLGAGKAAASMARAFEAAYPDRCEGLVVVPYGYSVPTPSIRVIEASHPIPDDAGLGAARSILDLAVSAKADDLVVALISGGASALLTLPASGIVLADKQQISRALLRSGAPISEINTVRKTLSAIKGGRLAAAAAPARVVTYVISDVPGDDPGTIGSGPTVADETRPEAALAILRAYRISVDARIESAMRANVGSGHGFNSEIHVIATPAMALEAAAVVARKQGFEPIILGDALEGEAREVAKVIAGIVSSVISSAHPGSRPCVILSGGETTVTLRGKGRGGRNTEFLLALALALRDAPGVSAIACDTDGIDGSEDNAGAWIDDGVTAESRSLSLDLSSCLADNDAYHAFAVLGRLVVTGPTLTNVNDFRAVAIR